MQPHRGGARGRLGCGGGRAAELHRDGAGIARRGPAQQTPGGGHRPAAARGAPARPPRPDGARGVSGGAVGAPPGRRCRPAVAGHSLARALPASSGGVLTGALRYALEHDTATIMLPLLERIASFRRTFDSPAAADEALGMTLLCKGHLPLRLICIPSFVGPSGAYQFARLATGLPPARTAYAVTLPGFGRGQASPPRGRSSWTPSPRRLAQLGRRSVRAARLLEVGGVLAHAVAEALSAEA